MVIMYVLGFLFCIMTNIKIRKQSDENDYGLSVVLAFLWSLSLVLVPLILFICFFVGIGFVIKIITEKVEKLLNKI